MKKGTTYKQKTVEEVLGAIESNHGNLTAAARELGMSSWALSVRIKRNPELKERLAYCRDMFIDLAEDGLYQHVEEKSLGAIMFTLKTIGKARGWGESQDITLNGFMTNTNLNLEKKLDGLSDEELKLLLPILKKLEIKDEDETNGDDSEL
jgi:hypothetical protein